MKDLSGKVAVVTGGGGGIGKAIAEELVAEGARVVVSDIQGALVEATVAELAARGGDVLGVRSDVTDPASMEALADATKGVTFVGRLATYRYYNMDQIVGQALATFRRLDAARRARMLGKETPPLAVAAE